MPLTIYRGQNPSLAAWQWKTKWFFPGCAVCSSATLKCKILDLGPKTNNRYYFASGVGSPLYPEFYIFTQWSFSEPGSLREMPDSNHRPLPLKSGALPMSHHHISENKLEQHEECLFGTAYTIEHKYVLKIQHCSSTSEEVFHRIISISMKRRFLAYTF